MKKLCTFLFLVSLVASAQKKPRTFEQFQADSMRIMRPKLVRPQFKFDNRVTFYQGQSLNITGFDAGVMLVDKLRLTAGYYNLNADLNAFRQTIDSNDVGRLIKLDYVALNTEFIYKDTRFFSLGLPLEFGFGQESLNFKNFTTNTIYRHAAGYLVMAHFGLSATFKPIRWFGLKGILGYRKTIYNQVKEFDFDGIFGSLGFAVDFQEIIRDIRMFRLMKRYHRGNNVVNAVQLITD